MATTIRDVMTKQPTTLSKTASILEAARAMSRVDIGNVVVVDNGKVCGILTDRDIVVRAVAEGRDVEHTRVADICSQDLTTVAPADDIDMAVQLMRQKAVRRLPVVENGKPVGIVSLGDLARERDPHSALGNISTAAPNR
jgi:CBS domain-containing protein